MRPRNPRDTVTALVLIALVAVVGCTIEVNINTDSDSPPEDPIVTVRPDAPEPPVRVTEPTPPEAPPAPEVRPRVPAPPVPYERVDPDDQAVRDALFRFRREAAEAGQEEQAPLPDVKPDPADGPTFTPFTQAPSILNRNEVIEALRREYPPLLREAGIGGSTVVFFFIDEEGVVHDARIARSSGHDALDQAALSVAQVYRFSPALNRDRRVPVWVQFPITFQPDR